MRKRITSLLLTLVMLLSLVPAMGVTASAAEPEWTTVNTYDQLKAALSNQNPPDNIKLGCDIDTGTLNSGVGILETLEVKGRKQLDLNGHTLRMYSEKTAVYDMFTIKLGDLTVLDSSSGHKGTILGSTYNDSCYLFDIQSNGKLTLNSGTLKVDVRKSISNNNRWRRVIYCYAGGTVTINGGTLHVAPETYEGDNNAYGQYFEKEYKDAVNGYCGYTLMAANSCKVSINGGTFQGPVRLDAGQDEWKKNEPRVIINGGTFENKVMLNDAGDGSVTLTEINGGTFLDYVQAWAAASFEDSFSTPEVVINGGEFHKKFWMRPKFPDGNGKNLIGYHVAAKLNGGTFHGTLSVDKNYTDYGSAYVSPRLSYSDVTFLADEMLGKNAVQTGKGTFAAQDTSSYREFISYYNKSERWSEGFVFEIKAVNGQPTKIIRDAWGMKSVTLDGNPINYAKDWNGAAVEITNDTAHTIKFTWKTLNTALSSAGYSYNATCDRYVSGSSTPTPDTISNTDTEYSFTIDKDAPAKVYSFDLHLNLKKTGSPYNIGIMGNEHIVKLAVNQAPVVTEISSAPVRLSAALTPDTPAPSAAAVGSGYTVDSINWYTDSGCNTPASAFVAGTKYYGKIVLKPEKNYKFAASTSAVPFCDDPNEDYSIVGTPAVAADGSSLTLIVSGTAVSALVWNSVDKTNQTYTIGDSALTLNAKATGGESSKPITYKLIAKKDGTETVKASATVAASLTDGFSAPLRFTETGSYECWFEATRGNVTITSDHFTVTVNAPGLSITNQSGDLTVEQNGTARLFVKAVGHGVKYEWQVKNDGTWEAISGQTAYDYAAPTDEAGAKTYRCEVTDKYGATKHTNEMKVTVTPGTDPTLTPAIPLAAVNGDAPDPAKLWPSKSVPGSGWQGLEAKYNVTAGDTFHGVATFSTIPTGEGYHLNGTPPTQDIYYRSYGSVQKIPVLGTISYEWKADKTKPWEGTIATSSTKNSADITIPSDVDTYYAQLSVTNTVGAESERSTVYITFHVSPAHTHTHSYAYAQLDATSHTKYCTAGDDSITEPHTPDANGMCTDCGYAPATYTVNVTDGTAAPHANVAPGTKVTLTANPAPSGQEFDKWAGNVAVASDNTFNMPSHNVTVAATYKPIAHTHDTDSKTWAPLNDDVHSRSCTAGDDQQFEDHKVNSWTDKGDGTHTGTCTVCNYVKTENHSWVFDSQVDATFTAPGKTVYKCADNCGVANKEESIPKLTAISAVNVTVTAPVKGATPGNATKTDATDTTYNVAATDWEPIVSGTFEGGTKYTVKVSLETTGNNRFTNATSFQINGKTATIVGTQPTATGAEDTKITLEFPATSSGSTGGGGGGGVTTYPITVKSAKNGDVTASHKTASKGALVTLTVDPDKGYVLDTLTVLDGKDKEIKLTEKNGKYTFTMPASKVTVEAMFKASAPTGKNPFVDVPAGSYYEDAVVWAVEKGITSGTSAVTFDPNGNCTRAQAVTFLWRAAGSPAPKTKVMPFTDVPSGSYYETAVLWAMEQGITKGTSDTAFSPNASCTRAQIVTFLWRANGSPAVSGNSAFTDVASDAYYAAAVAWAEKNGVTGGIGGGLFGSGNNCTRAQIVTFLYRAMK